MTRVLRPLQFQHVSRFIIASGTAMSSRYCRSRGLPAACPAYRQVHGSRPMSHNSNRTSTKTTHIAEHNTIDLSKLIEEETIRGYKAEHYYPVRIGDTFQNRYSVIGKLGYGSASTVWLCHDLQKKNEHVAVKVYINSSQAHRELPIYNHIKSLDSQHGGHSQVRRLLDSFVLNGPDGQHTCLVHEALGMNLEELRDLVPDREFSPDLIRQTLRDVLRAMHFLHEEAHVIHTDIQPKNIQLGILDDSAFSRFEEDERAHPIPRKELPSRTVYISRPMPLTKGAPLLCDLSEARFGNAQNTDLVMPNVYRAPEVVLGMPWSYPVDIWGFAMTLWDLFEPKRLFSPHDENRVYSEHQHLAQMISIIGPPPLEFLQRSEKSKRFFDSEGNWKGTVPIPHTSLENAEQRLQGDEKRIFLTFMRKMLKWKPEDRDSLQDVFMDEWLLADLIASGDVVREE